MRRNKILEVCVVLSILVHTGFFAFIQKHCFWFLEKQKEDLWLVEKMSQDQILEEAFESRIEEAGVAVKPQVEKIQPLAHKTLHLVTPPEPLFFTTSLDQLVSVVPVEFSLPTIERTDLFANLPKDLIQPVSQPQIAMLKPISQPLQPTLPPTPTPKETPFASHSAPRLDPPVIAARAMPPTPLMPLPNLPTLADLQTVNLSESFDTELTFLPKPDGDGYLFALTLIPHPDLNLPKMKQNILFLVDRSNSIQHGRLSTTKHAIRKAIEELDEDDRFNIVAFDAKVDKAAPSFLKATGENKAKAEKFLEGIQLGNLFIHSDAYKPLLHAIPPVVADDELYTAILLTDGENLAKKPAQRALFRDWTLQNQGRVGLYAIGVAGDHNQASLDVACAFNQGKYFSATTSKGLKRKILKLAKNTRHPIAKGLSFKPILNRGNVQVLHLTPTLYLDQPYVLLGSVDSLEDCIVFVQGRLKDRWFNIKKTISFANGKKGTNALLAEWALQQAYQKYQLYMQDENPKYLAEAQSLLEPYHIQALQ
jgi:hypothetical protein